MADLLTLASLLPLLPLLPLLALALALIGELAGELRLTALLPVYQPAREAGPMVRFLQEERTAPTYRPPALAVAPAWLPLAVPPVAVAVAVAAPVVRSARRPDLFKRPGLLLVSETVTVIR